MWNPYSGKHHMIALGECMDVKSVAGPHVRKRCKPRHLGAGKILSGGHFQVGGFACKNADALTRPFGERRVIGEAFASCRSRAAMRLKNKIESKSLRRLHDPQGAAIERFGDPTAVVDGFDRIRKRDTRDRRAGAPTGADGAVDQRGTDKGTGGIMDENEPGAM